MPARRRRAYEAEQKARWEAMMDEATVDCYDESEAFAGMLATLEDRLDFPSPAKALGEAVEVIGLDAELSSERHGVVAKVRKRRWHYTTALADVKVVQKNTETAEWLDCRYRRPDGTDIPDRLQKKQKLMHTHTVDHLPNCNALLGDGLYHKMLGGKSKIGEETSACTTL